MTGLPLYVEEQRFRQWWVWAIVVAVAAIAWWSFIQQILLGRPFGENLAPDWGVWLFWSLAGIGIPALLLTVKLVIKVDSARVIINYGYMVRRGIPLSEIARVEARTYHPLREYGGWGIKGWSRRNVAYNASGNRGVQLTLEDGRRVMLGSQRPEELAQVIERQRLGATRPAEPPRSSS